MRCELRLTVASFLADAYCCRGCSPFHLSGMSEASLANGVLVWRPLLEHTKEAIFAFAHK